VRGDPPDPNNRAPSDTEVKPVPPLFTVKVPVVSESAIPSDEVAKAWTLAVAPVGLPRIVFAPI